MSTSLQNSELAGTALLDRTRAVWMGRLAQLWDGDARPKFDLFRKQVAGHSDALSYLQEWHAGAGPVCAEIISATIERIQSERFDISDLFAEIRSLSDSLQELASDTPHALRDCVSYRRALDELFEAVIKETSVVYERFSEIGRHALCILDSDGRVTFANRSASALLAPTGVKGRPFVESLNTASQERIATRIASLRPGEQQYETIEIDDNEGRTRTMSAELTRVPRATPRCCYCVSITPSARLFGFEDDILEDFEEGTIRVAADRTIFYANREARKILGRDPFEPVHIYDVMKGEANRRKIEAELRKRDAGRPGKYKAKVTKPSGREVPISVTAIPEFDINGTRAGSLTFISNVEPVIVRHQLESCLQEDNSWEDAAATLCRVLMDHIDADMIFIYRWADDLCHASTVASFKKDGQKFKADRHWWRMTEPQIKWNQQPGLAREGDMKAFLAQKDWRDLAKDPAMRRLIDEEGIKSFVRLSIRKDGAYKAGISLASKQLNGFSEEDEELLKALPLAEIVLSILQRKDRDEKDFQFNLVKEMAACDSFGDLADLVTDRLAKHYDWDHVSIFDVIEEKQTLKVISQGQGSDVNYALRPDYQQSTEEGLLGRCVTQEKRVYAPDVGEEADYLAGHNATQSEIVIPVFCKAYDPPRVFWLLNIEHSQRNFLIEHEISDLEVIAQHIDFIVNRMIDRSTYENALRTTSDGVIITDGEGEIRHVNPAAAKMLHCEAPDLLGRGICELFEDKNVCQNLLQGKISDSRKAKLARTGKDAPLTVLLSVLQLPDEISDTYFIFKSLEAEERLADLEAIELLVSDIAQEMKTPLSLLHGMLRRLAGKDDSSLGLNLSDFVDKAREQLKKVELTYDRVAYSDTDATTGTNNEVLITLDRMLLSIRDAIAVDKDGALDIEADDGLPPVLCNPYQIRFVFMTLVSYLLRNLSDDQKIRVSLHRTENEIRAVVSAPFPEVSGEACFVEVDDINRTKTNMSLGRKAIEQCLRKNGGRFEEPVFDAGRLCFIVRLPVYDANLESE